MIKENFDMKSIEEKINNKFLELKLNFESQNKEIFSKIKEINLRLDKIYNKEQTQKLENLSNLENDLKLPYGNYDSVIESTNSKLKNNQTLNLNIFKENIESSINDKITKQLKQLDDNYFNKINAFQKKIEEIKKENKIFKDAMKKTDIEFNLVKLRFGEVLDFIRDKNFWKKFIPEIIFKNGLIDKNNMTEKSNSIFSPFNYYKYFDIEGSKNFMDEANNTIPSNERNDINRSVDVEIKNILIKEPIKNNNKYKTPNIPSLNINKIFKELNRKLPKNINHHNKSLSYNTHYKKIQVIPLRNYLKQDSLNEEDKNENVINSINSNRQNNKSKDKSLLINNKEKTKLEVNEYILQADFSKSIDKNKNWWRIDSKNLSESYILKQLEKLKKLYSQKSDSDYYKTLPLSMKYNIKNKRNNKLDKFNILPYKDIKKGNIEDLFYSQFKKDKIGHVSQINFKKGIGDYTIINNTNKKKRFPVIHRDKSN